MCIRGTVSNAFEEIAQVIKQAKRRWLGGGLGDGTDRSEAEVGLGSPNKMCLASSPSVKTRCMNNDVEMLLGSDHRAVVVSRCRAEFSLKLSRRAGLQCGCRRYQQSRAPAAAAIACIAWHVLLRCMHAMYAKVGAGAIDAYVGN